MLGTENIRDRPEGLDGLRMSSADRADPLRAGRLCEDNFVNSGSVSAVFRASPKYVLGDLKRGPLAKIVSS
jgi:hypothetical protein